MEEQKTQTRQTHRQTDRHRQKDRDRDGDGPGFCVGELLRKPPKPKAVM